MVKFYTISVKMPTGKTIKLSVHWPYTIESIKAMIARLIEILWSKGEGIAMQVDGVTKRMKSDLHGAIQIILYP